MTATLDIEKKIENLKSAKEKVKLLKGLRASLAGFESSSGFLKVTIEDCPEIVVFNNRREVIRLLLCGWLHHDIEELKNEILAI